MSTRAEAQEHVDNIIASDVDHYETGCPLCRYADELGLWPEGSKRPSS